LRKAKPEGNPSLRLVRIRGQTAIDNRAFQR
jgi:hypothetical protein